MPSALSNFLNKEVPVWQILAIAAVVGLGHFICYPACNAGHSLPPSPRKQSPADSIVKSKDDKPSAPSSNDMQIVAPMQNLSPIQVEPAFSTSSGSSSVVVVATDNCQGGRSPPRIEIPQSPTAITTNSRGHPVILAPLTDEETVTEDDWVDFKTDWLFYDGPYPIVDEYTRADGPSKLVLCVNMELKMGKGKIAAQCGHATLGAYKLAKKYCKTGLSNWESAGTKKIAVKVEEEIEFYDLLEKAKLDGVVCYIVQDTGKTQIAAGSRTVLALGPAPEAVINQISGHLKLL